ncbi:hypothetical protein DM50_3072 [Burkholderia mallei]|nr:hypothetical protein DM75_3158 [Burkholderia mallei]KOT02068.1 hypothetical protein DM50_3072 [Burkholderia mallei]
MRRALTRRTLPHGPLSRHRTARAATPHSPHARHPLAASSPDDEATHRRRFITKCRHPQSPFELLARFSSVNSGNPGSTPSNSVRALMGKASERFEEGRPARSRTRLWQFGDMC